MSFDEKSDQHIILSKLKECAIEMGVTPTQAEFSKHSGIGRHMVESRFGSFSLAVQAAGLDPAPVGRKKKVLSNDIFKADIEQVIQDYVPREVKEKIIYTPTVVIGDTHFPFVSQRVLDSIYEFINKEKPGRVIQVGDLYDMYAHSKFPRSHNIYTPDQEEDLGRKGAVEMWQIIKSLVPKAELVQLKGNHDVRPVKRTAESAPSLERWVEKYLNDLMTFDGVTLIKDPRQEYYADEVQYIHGHYTGIGKHRDYAMRNTVCGHQHKGGVMYRRINGQTLWELNAGLVGDPESKALAYTPQKVYDATVGFGVIDNYGPRFICL